MFVDFNPSSHKNLSSLDTHNAAFGFLRLWKIVSQMSYITHYAKQLALSTDCHPASCSANHETYLDLITILSLLTTYEPPQKIAELISCRTERRKELMMIIRQRAASLKLNLDMLCQSSKHMMATSSNKHSITNSVNTLLSKRHTNQLHPTRKRSAAGPLQSSATRMFAQHSASSENGAIPRSDPPSRRPLRISRLHNSNKPT